MSLRLQLLCLTLLVVSSTILSKPLPAFKHKRSQGDNNDLGDTSGQGSAKSKGEEGGYYFEGDIILPPGLDPYGKNNKTDQPKRQVRMATDDSGSGSRDPDTTISPTESYKDRTDLWEGGKVPFKLETNLNPMDRDIFEDAMAMWTEATDECITFVEATSKDIDFILFRKDEKGCSSLVGRAGGQQNVDIGSSCSSKGNAAHEIGHALGLWHEHSRRDRDDYIEVFRDNIKEDFEKYFGILSEELFSKVPPVSYDIESIMHYGPRVFSKDNALETIRPRNISSWDMCDKPALMGQRSRISYKDALRVKLLYGCGEVTPTDMPKDCDMPTITPMPTPPMPTPTTPSPVSAIPTPTVTEKLQTNDIITLYMGSDNDFGIRCIPSLGCTPTPCHSSIFGDSVSHCSSIENQFRIIRPGNTRIEVGDKVLLRSVYKPTMWLNCSGVNKECTISACTTNAADPNNSSYISTCDDHFFTIKAGKRKEGKVVSTKQKIQFKSYTSDSYLNCVGKKCEMVESSTCAVAEPGRDGLQKKNDDGTCNPQSYNVTKL